MNRQNRTNLLVAVVGTATLLACSPEATTSPKVAGALYARASSGSYILSFVDNNLQPVSTLIVGTQELILKAHVDDGAGNPAQKGSVSFQYCGYKGLPPNDITRADEAPSAACANGAASWTSINAGLSGLAARGSG